MNAYNISEVIDSYIIGGLFGWFIAAPVLWEISKWVLLGVYYLVNLFYLYYLL